MATVKLNKFALVLGLAAFVTLESVEPAFANESDECLIARSHARSGQEVYGQVFDKAEKFLKNNEIDYDLYGKKRFYQEQLSYGTRYNEKYCSDVYGGCAADKFDIDISLNQLKKDYPVIILSPKSGAKDTDFGYIILGKLSGVINHKDCQGSEFINGHTWRANIWKNEITGNMNQKGYVRTSLSQVGAMIQNGYYGTLPSYENKTLVIKIEDFGNGPNYERFISIIDELPGSGIVTKYN